MADKPKDKAARFAKPAEPIELTEEARQRARARKAATAAATPPLEAEDDPVRAALRARFFADAPAVADMLERDAPPRDWLVRDLLPAGEGALLIGEGGIGKGHFQLLLSICIATGWNFLGFEVARPRRVLLVAKEDDLDEIHRRLRAAVRLVDPVALGRGKPWRALLEANLHVIGLRGVASALDDPRLHDTIAEKAEAVGDVGLILLDPLGRLLPAGVRLNDQDGASAVHGAIDALVARTRAMVMLVHHVSKAGRSTAPGEDRGAGSSSGSHLLEDLARVVLRLIPLGADEKRKRGLDEHRTYIEMQAPKANYSGALREGIVLVREAGGALAHHVAPSRESVLDARVLAVLEREILDGRSDGLTREEWERACGQAAPRIAKNDARDARKRLLEAGRVVSGEPRKGSGSGPGKQVFRVP